MVLKPPLNLLSTYYQDWSPTHYLKGWWLVAKWWQFASMIPRCTSNLQRNHWNCSMFQQHLPYLKLETVILIFEKGEQLLSPVRTSTSHIITDHFFTVQQTNVESHLITLGQLRVLLWHTLMIGKFGMTFLPVCIPGKLKAFKSYVLYSYTGSKIGCRWTTTLIMSLWSLWDLVRPLWGVPTHPLTHRAIFWQNTSSKMAQVITTAALYLPPNGYQWLLEML